MMRLRNSNSFLDNLLKSLKKDMRLITRQLTELMMQILAIFDSRSFPYFIRHLRLLNHHDLIRYAFGRSHPACDVIVPVHKVFCEKSQIDGSLNNRVNSFATFISILRLEKGMFFLEEAVECLVALSVHNSTTLGSKH